MPGVTKEQIRQAREADLFAYLQQHEHGVLKRDGPNYRHKEHDSLVYVPAKNYWYWNSRGKRINALDYLMEIRGYCKSKYKNVKTRLNAALKNRRLFQFKEDDAK